ncbi:hypothetical protein ACVWXM_007725 [Bradyrhizobium sp. GM7.3]
MRTTTTRSPAHPAKASVSATESAPHDLLYWFKINRASMVQVGVLYC